MDASENEMRRTLEEKRNVQNDFVEKTIIRIEKRLYPLTLHQSSVADRGLDTH